MCVCVCVRSGGGTGDMPRWGGVVVKRRPLCQGQTDRSPRVQLGRDVAVNQPVT